MEIKIKARTVKDVSSADFIAQYAMHLKRNNLIDIPNWADYAKTACFKEISPQDPDWIYIRTASLARHIYLMPNKGVGGL